MGAPNLISDNMDCGLSYSVISYLKKLSQQVSPTSLAQSGPVHSSQCELQPRPLLLALTGKQWGEIFSLRQASGVLLFIVSARGT